MTGDILYSNSSQADVLEIFSRPSANAGAGDLNQQILDSLPVRVVILDCDGMVVGGNTATGTFEAEGESWHGCTAAVGTNYFSEFRVAAAQGHGNAALALSGMLDVLHGRAAEYRMECTCRGSDGLHWFRIRVAPLAAVAGLIVTHEDITDRKRAEFQLNRCRALLDHQVKKRTAELESHNAALQCQVAGYLESESGCCHSADVFASSSQAIVITDAERRTLTVNDAFTGITGYTRADVVGMDICAFRGVDLGGRFHDSVWRSLETVGNWQGEITNRRKNGERYTAWETLDAVRDEEGRVKNYVSLFSDIGPIKQVQSRLLHLAHHDSLTGLANRLLFWARLDQSMEHARRHRQRIALLFLDIDHFKSINDAFGHAAGDELLISIATRLQGQVRQEDTVARLGGDEFGVIVEDVSELRDATALADKLDAVIREPVHIANQWFRPQISIGIGLFPDDAEAPPALLKAADTAMYRAKRGRRGI